ncbi:DUF7264 domain-containing protein [Nocardia carnea]|uniref:LtfC-like domain-containing protein n=1 Tax=Nocardia carnea TaxID=37328 RepID=UPI00245610E4|nr:hypothetical protein [Nocardia carnea]
MLVLGTPAAGLEISLAAGQDFVGRIEYHDPLGTPAPWPFGLTAWLRFTSRAGFEAIWPATITGSRMEWIVAADLVEMVPFTAHAELWLEYPTDPAFVWVEGPVSRCGPPGFGCPIAVPGPNAGAVAVPVPGPQGPPGSGGGVGDYFHTQSTPSSSWTVAHGLNKQIVGALVYSLDMSTEYGAVHVEQLDANTCRLWVSPPLAGIARIY